MGFYKLSKVEVEYTPHAMKPEERCEFCYYFETPGLCKLVRGGVNSEGWCNRFERKNEDA